MGDPVVGGELIHLVEISQDKCAQNYSVTCAARLSARTRTNLFNYSAQLDNDDWVETEATTTANQADSPTFGNPTAEAVFETAANSVHYTQQTVTIGATGNHNVSIYAKNNGIRYLGIAGPGANDTIIFDLNDGSVHLSGSGVVSSASSNEGDGWYRLSVVFSVSSGSQFFRYYLTNGTFSAFAGTGGNGLFLWGAQVTQGATLLAYQETLGSDDTQAATLDDAGRSGEKCFKTRATCQDPANYNPGTLTIKCGRNQSTLPRDEYIFPNLKSISTQPSRLNTSSRSRNEPLGQRASMTATLMDHPNTDRFVDDYADERISGVARADGIGYDPLERGFFWAKWRTRNLYYLGRSIRALQGVVDPVDLTQLTVRNYVIESVSGPGVDGVFRITGKDPLKLADNDRAQAPIASQGELLGTGANAPDIDDTETTFDVTPAGIGNSGYPASGKISIGKEIMSFTRSGDTFTVTRGVDNTEASAHDEGDTVQLVLEYSGELVSDILLDLLTTYADLDSSFIPHTDGSTTSEWGVEVANFIPNGYTAIIPKPTGVKTLIGELSEQAGFSIWWDEIGQKVRLSAVKQPGSGAITITDNHIIDGTLTVKDRPDARISQVWTNYGLINPTENLDNANNYTSTLVTVDAEAGQSTQYGQDAIRKINSRWIPSTGGKSIAQDLNGRLISRFRDVIREVTFSLPSYRADEIKMGDSHVLSTQYIQDPYGQNEQMPIRIMSVEQAGDVLRVEAEELRFKADPDETTRNVIIDTDTNDFNLRDAFFNLYPAGPISTTDIVCIIEAGIVVGSSDPSILAFDVGDWSGDSYNSITIEISTGAYISGAGADGGQPNGGQGGTALKTIQAITVNNSGTLQGGGGGGGTGSSGSVTAGGGGGAGRNPGQGNTSAAFQGAAGTLTQGGAGGDGGATTGGDGGNPGQAGQAGSGSLVSGTGGAAGYAIDGASFVTLTGNAVVGPTTG